MFSKVFPGCCSEFKLLIQCAIFALLLSLWFIMGSYAFNRMEPCKIINILLFECRYTYNYKYVSNTTLLVLIKNETHIIKMKDSCKRCHECGKLYILNRTYDCQTIIYKDKHDNNTYVIAGYNLIVNKILAFSLGILLIVMTNTQNYLPMRLPFITATCFFILRINRKKYSK